MKNSTANQGEWVFCAALQVDFRSGLHFDLRGLRKAPKSFEVKSISKWKLVKLWLQEKPFGFLGFSLNRLNEFVSFSYLMTAEDHIWRLHAGNQNIFQDTNYWKVYLSTKHYSFSWTSIFTWKRRSMDGTLLFTKRKDSNIITQPICLQKCRSDETTFSRKKLKTQKLWTNS